MKNSHTPIRIAVVESGWHGELVSEATGAFIQRVHEEVPDLKIDRLRVPGAFEIPLRAQRLARSGDYAAIAGCALVVDGGIYRHDFVASAVVNGLMQVQLAEDLPMFSAVLTPHHFQEHAPHLEFFGAHMQLKGRELAEAVLTSLRAEDKVASAE
ncbi:MAG: 6,7-dimethyl-8-ribityllumazine synthase [Candidatus Leucobacter sulfamidivorax]|nr:6,7-dimethyl-8-ribityllumazine synthase [Candidatus Leucobacter sulfamidivorax]